MAEREPVRCRHGDTDLEGFMVRPRGDGPFPAVIVMHSALGLRHQVGEKARLLADLGYLAVASDMYGAGADADTPEQAGARYEPLMKDPAQLRDRTVRWFETVAALPEVDPARIAAIGYCFGGKCVLEMARSGVDVKAVSSFHGILATHAPATPGSIAAHVAAWCGTEDPFAPAETTASLRAELDGAGTVYTITEFGGVAHSFTDPDAAEMGMPGIRYDAVADAVSWSGTVAMLSQVLGT